VGVLNERAVVDLLIDHGQKGLDEMRAGDVMGDPMPEIGPGTPLRAVARILERRPAVLVTSGPEIVGIVTRADLLRLVVTEPLAARRHPQTT
jgi:predicted transcriptional regulator